MTIQQQAVEGFTLAELIREADREVALRVNVYRGRVRDGKMREEAATRQIALMRAIAERLRAEAEQDNQSRGLA
jgi:hypothetical protein